MLEDISYIKLLYNPRVNIAFTFTGSKRLNAARWRNPDIRHWTSYSFGRLEVTTSASTPYILLSESMRSNCNWTACWKIHNRKDWVGPNSVSNQRLINTIERILRHHHHRRRRHHLLSSGHWLLKASCCRFQSKILCSMWPPLPHSSLCALNYFSLSQITFPKCPLVSLSPFVFLVATPMLSNTLSHPPPPSWECVFSELVPP